LERVRRPSEQALSAFGLAGSENLPILPNVETSVTKKFHGPGASIEARKSQWAVPAAISIALLAGLLLRFVEFSSPPYDSHGFRQTQTLSTIEFFYLQGIDLLHPKTNYMGYPGVFVLELPIFQALAALLYKVLGPHLEIVRILNILLGAGTTWLLYGAVKRLLDRPTSILTALIYWLAPVNIVYQRSMLLDPMGVFFGVLSFSSLVALLAPAEADIASSGRARYWLHFGAFAIATWLAAMIKTLYLWPVTLLLLCAVGTRRIKFDWGTVRLFSVFAIAGSSFLLWNRYAAVVNDQSAFSRGLQPTSLLGFSALVDPKYYVTMIIRRPKWWLGPLGALLYPFGLWAMWRERRNSPRPDVLLLLVLIPPLYLLLFSFINRPHDYYQLIITPFLSVVPAYGLAWLAKRMPSLTAESDVIGRFSFPALCAIFLVAAPLTYLFWFHGGQPDPRIVLFDRLCAGKVAPGSSGMLFVAIDYCSSPPDSHIPEFLYAAHLWGYGRVVPNDNRARAYFEQWAPEFPKLDYVVLYGTDLPNWLPPRVFALVSEDVDHRLYIFRRPPRG
jgi:hypothetical protein